ncbi:sulfate adenylyltransferase [Snodgrassella communis]|uniref:sulfate adenylyltransferase n=1 Tax=Snodgrassella communis TaxID=2946699 RepID=A0A836MQM2_9NEIS|nr:GTP-binding protein [Snodgrassella communis]KDN14625.1 Sulfate adenylyltransferase subunit 1 [Snodgrassella communis]PIT08148.1 sulfate adenylyltransferase [Snodgrassella communis]PIT26157.1 sulfate adenylyltransferase [Snodgrassella communis]PIT26656.1 sulfate adenylyltransferase [Snodgrassella communis]PIT35167.1 sulfate adenylyltransferase [Snodgrassella communis]
MSTDSVLRFITAGSVDDGKSTLIGRLLFDSQSLLADQVAALYHGKHKRTADGVPDFAQLTDGLAAEREQGITIDVAYRYFATPARKFIIADTPGHEQYTRNMVTGASTADAAIILIDATRLDYSEHTPALLPQTRRHSAILKLLGTAHIIVAVNKLDLLDYSEEKFNAIKRAYSKLASALDLHHISYVPISALNGDNIVTASAHMLWYQGQPLLRLLENLPVANRNSQLLSAPALFPVQRVARLDGSSADDFRGYQGRLEQGSLCVGDSIRIEPAGQNSTITAIYTPAGQVEQAQAGSVLTIVLADDIDISRGDSIVAADSTLQPTRNISASVCWFDSKPLNATRRYWLKHTTQTVYTRIRQVDYLLDVQSLNHRQDSDSLQLNDIGRIQLSVQKPIVATTYQANPATGAFILIDEATNHTVAAGMITSLV